MASGADIKADQTVQRLTHMTDERTLSSGLCR